MNNYVIYFMISGLSFVLFILFSVIFSVFSLLGEMTGVKFKSQLEKIKTESRKQSFGTTEMLGSFSSMLDTSLLNRELVRVQGIDTSGVNPLPEASKGTAPISKVEVVEDAVATDEFEEDDIRTGYIDVVKTTIMYEVTNLTEREIVDE